MDGILRGMRCGGNDVTEGEYNRNGTSSFSGSVAVDGEIFLVGSKSAPLVFSMSVKIGLEAVLYGEEDGHVQKETDTASLVVKDPDNAECSIFNGEYDSEEEITAIQQDPARVFGPDSITDKEIRLLTLKEGRDCCRNEVSGSWDEDEAGPLLMLLVNACRECAGEDGNLAWEYWAPGAHNRNI